MKNKLLTEAKQLKTRSASNSKIYWDPKVRLSLENSRREISIKTIDFQAYTSLQKITGRDVISTIFSFFLLSEAFEHAQFIE